MVKEALESFYGVRETPGLKKKPSTSEFLDWLKILMSEDIPPGELEMSREGKHIPPFHGALLKNEQDLQLFDRHLSRSWHGS